jgi:hypothetical protein
MNEMLKLKLKDFESVIDSKEALINSLKQTNQVLTKNYNQKYIQ